MLEVDSLNQPAIQVMLRPVLSDGEGPEGANSAPGVPVPESPMHPTDDPYYREIAHFLDCIRSGEEFLVSPLDGLEALRITLAGIESLRIGQPVDLDTFDEEG